MKRLLLTLALVLAAAPTLIGTAMAQSPPPSPEPVPALRAPAHVFTLSNGMTLLVRPDRRAPTVVHMLWVRVGAMDEVDGTSGVAHALEHMMFKGSAALGAGEFSQRIAAMGARQNAFTSRDATAYHQQLPADRLEDVMRLEAERFAHNQWPDEEFVREMAVIQEERRQRTEESPQARFREAFNATLWQASPYRRPIIGWMSDLQAMTPQDVRDFYRRWYVPANAAVVVVGDVDPAQVRAMAERHYGRIAPGVVPARKPREEPEQHGPRGLEYRAATEQPQVVLAWRAPRWQGGDGADDRDALALAVLAAVLDGYRGARLDRALVQGQGPGGRRLADGVSADMDLIGRGPVVFSLSAVPARGVPPEAVAAALKAEVQRIAREGVSEDELRRVKTQWRAADVYRLDSLYGQAHELGNHWINGWALGQGERLMAQLRAVTAEQVRAVAQRRFDDRWLTTGVLVPEAREREAVQ